MKEKNKFSKSEEIKTFFNENYNNPSLLRKELKRYLKEGEDSQDIHEIGAAYCFTALLNYNSGQRNNILSYALKAASIFDQTTNYEMIAKSYNVLGIAYLAQENYQMALESYRIVSQVVSNHKGCSITKDIIDNNIAECYYQMGDYKKSTKLFEKCFNDAVKANKDFFGIAIYGINLSDCYGSLKEYDKAIAILDKVEDIVFKINSKMIISAFYARYAVISYLTDNIKNGNRYADITIKTIRENEDTYELHRDFEKIAHAQIKFHEYERADQFAQILLDYSKETGHTLDKIIAYRVQADYFKTVNDTEKALKYYAQLNELYIKQQEERNAMQLNNQINIEKTNKEVKELLQRIKVTEVASKLEPLTNMLNRNALIEITNDFLNTAKNTKKKIGSIFIDIDYFKEYNDNYGHPQGDQVIKKIAKICLKYESSKVKFSRYGGDEFFAIVLGAKDSELEEITKNIVKDVKSENIIHETSPMNIITLSIGLYNTYVKEEDNNTILDIVNHADKALYYSKKMGRNNIFRYDENNLDEEGKEDPYIRVKF